jgi:hypothetical protein
MPVERISPSFLPMTIFGTHRPNYLHCQGEMRIVAHFNFDLAELAVLRSLAGAVKLLAQP